jgi:hypothetical protein
MSLSKISHNIKHRENPKDVFITPIKLAKKLIDLHGTVDNEIWLDPFKNNGSFYNNYPDNIEKDWCEILDNKDFFKYDKLVDVISSNPPYSMLNRVLEQTLKICSREFGYLIGWNNLTARRIEMCNKAGFYIKSIEMFKVYKWYGMSCYVIFSKQIDNNIISFNRTVWR